MICPRCRTQGEYGWLYWEKEDRRLVGTCVLCSRKFDKNGRELEPKMVAVKRRERWTG